MKHKRSLSIALIAIFLAICWIAFNARRLPTLDAPPMSGGIIDLSAIDLNTTIVELPLAWEYYPGLHTPQAIKGGGAGTPRAFSVEDETTHPIGTYRVTLRLPLRATYALYAWSLDYATRIFIDGEEALSVGTVADNAMDFVPRIQQYILPIVPQDETVEIVIQYANFTHPEGGAMRTISFSAYQNIQLLATNALLPTYLFSGGLTLIAVFYLLQFAIYRRRELASFALCCLLLALRSQPLVISLLASEYDWHTLYRCFFIGSSMVFPCFLLLTYFLNPPWYKRWALPVTFGLVGAVDLVVLFAPVSIGSQLVYPAILMAVPCTLYYFVKTLMMFPRGSGADRLSIAGLIIFFIAYMIELLLANSVPIITRTGLAPFGMAAAVLFYMLALELRQKENAVHLEQERRHSENLATLNAMKTEFLANITHELKTPLTIMSGYAQDTLLELSDETPSVSEMLHNQRHIITETDKLNRMVNQLLDTTALESGSMRLRKEPVSLAALLRRMTDACDTLLHAHGNQSVLSLAEDLPDIPADRERIEQVLLNLLSNATRHTVNGTITLSLAAIDGGQQITVRDDGEGMDAQTQAQVFHSYVQRQKGRSGLGLYICKKIINQHAGRIWLESEAGAGTAVAFWLPATGSKEDAHG